MAWLQRHNADGDEDELRLVAAEMKNALGVSKNERQRLLGGKLHIAKARLLSQAEYSIAQGDPSIPLFGDRTEDKVALSGRSASLLNMDWMVRHYENSGQQLPPPFGNLDSHDTSEQEMATRLERHARSGVREKQRKLEDRSSRRTLERTFVFWKQAANQRQNVRYQMLKLAFAHFKVYTEVQVYLRHPVRRLQHRQREQQRAARLNPRIVHFAGALDTDIRVLIPEQVMGAMNPYAGSVYRAESELSGYYVAGHSYEPDPNVIWHSPARNKFSVHKLRNLPFTVKRIPIDDADSKMDYEEYRKLQRYGGGNDDAWRRALMIAGGVEEIADRAIWNEPDHHMLRIATRQEGVVRSTLERDIEHVISEGIFPDTYHPDESRHVTVVRGMCESGEDGVRRACEACWTRMKWNSPQSTSSTPPD